MNFDSFVSRCTRIKIAFETYILYDATHINWSNQIMELVGELC